MAWGNAHATFTPVGEPSGCHPPADHSSKAFRHHRRDPESLELSPATLARIRAATYTAEHSSTIGSRRYRARSRAAPNSHDHIGGRQRACSALYILRGA